MFGWSSPYSISFKIHFSFFDLSHHIIVADWLTWMLFFSHLHLNPIYLILTFIFGMFVYGIVPFEPQFSSQDRHLKLLSQSILLRVFFSSLLIFIILFFSCLSVIKVVSPPIKVNKLLIFDKIAPGLKGNFWLLVFVACFLFFSLQWFCRVWDFEIRPSPLTDQTTTTKNTALLTQCNNATMGNLYLSFTVLVNFSRKRIHFHKITRNEMEFCVVVFVINPYNII